MDWLKLGYQHSGERCADFRCYLQVDFGAHRTAILLRKSKRDSIEEFHERIPRRCCRWPCPSPALAASCTPCIAPAALREPHEFVAEPRHETLRRIAQCQIAARTSIDEIWVLTPGDRLRQIAPTWLEAMGALMLRIRYAPSHLSCGRRLQRGPCADKSCRSQLVTTCAPAPLFSRLGTACV